MNDYLSKDPLQGITLEQRLIKLVEHFGWQELAYRICINCFTSDPSIKSSLKFLRSTPWVRQKVEGLYIKLADKTVTYSIR
ncbi:MAG: VF530 family DNA-binding protein [Yersinia sp. (in: enterobacteria)]